MFQSLYRVRVLKWNIDAAYKWTVFVSISLQSEGFKIILISLDWQQQAFQSLYRVRVLKSEFNPGDRISIKFQSLYRVRVLKCFLVSLMDVHLWFQSLYRVRVLKWHIVSTWRFYALKRISEGFIKIFLLPEVQKNQGKKPT